MYLIFLNRHDNLRSVGAYDRFIQERFERSLDLYLCPRMKKKKVFTKKIYKKIPFLMIYKKINIDPESLIPKLPNPKELKPFPSSLSITYKGHSEKVRSISIDPNGLYLASCILSFI